MKLNRKSERLIRTKRQTQPQNTNMQVCFYPLAVLLPIYWANRYEYSYLHFPFGGALQTVVSRTIDDAEYGPNT